MSALFRRLASRVSALFHGRALDRDFDEELRLHLEMMADDNIRSGMTPADARRAAAIRLGMASSLAEQHRRVRGLPAVESIAQDVRHAVRRLLARPAQTLPIVLILSCGVGVATALFSILDSALWHRVPFRDADRLVEIWSDTGRFLFRGLTHQQILAWREQTDLFDWIEAYEPASLIYQSERGTREVDAAIVTPDLFRRLGATSHIGRLFNDTDGRPGSDRNVLLSHAFWSGQFGRDKAVVGRTVLLDGASYAVVGVMPADFRFPDANSDLWLPHDAAVPPREGNGPGRESVGPRLGMLARLKDNDSFDRTNTLVKARGRAVNDRAGTAQPLGAALLRFGGNAGASTRQVLLMLGGAVALLLLIVCVNVAALTLSRDIARAHAIAIRAALGASRRRLLREHLLEHLLTGCLGAVGGLAVASGVIAAVGSVLPIYMTGGTNPVDLEARVLVFAAAVGVLASLVFGLPTALRASAFSILEVVQRSSRTVSESRWSRRVRVALVGAQVCLSLVLLVGAGLMARSVTALYSADRGFDPERLMEVRVGLPRNTYPATRDADRFVESAVASLRQLPGIRQVTAGEIPPGGSKSLWGALEIAEGAVVDKEEHRARLYEVLPNFFSTLGIRTLEGGTFSNDNDPPGAVVVSQRFASLHWPDGSAIGRRFRLEAGTWQTIIGVVADVRFVTAETAEPLPQVYHRIGQSYEGGIGIAGRAASTIGEERTLAVRLAEQGPSREAIADAIGRLDPTVVVATNMVDNKIADEIARSRLVFLLMTGFALFALLVCATGLYGLVAYSVEQRQREIGIRIALGARPGAVGVRVVVAALSLTMAAIVAGLFVATGLVEFLRSELYGVSPSDPLTIAGVSMALVLTAVVAAWRPAVRATRIDPAMLLRGE